MKFNSCVSSKSFEDKFWCKIFNLLHEDMDYDVLNYDKPIPQLIWIYWYYIWRNDRKKIGQFLNPSNMKLRHLHKIWEYTQTLASIYHFSNLDLENKKIISLGAGIEPCLFTLSKLGGKVIASDIYFEKNYWHTEWVRYIREEPEIFSHYKGYKPKIKFLNINLRSKEDLAKLGAYDIIYSISSLEHIFSSLKKKIRFFNHIVEHLNPKGIFSFTADLVIKFDRTRLYTIYLRYFLFKIRKIFNIPQKYKIQPYYNPFRTKSSKSVLYNLLNLHRYYRRYDFYTIEELNQIIKVLRRKNIYLVEDVCWRSCLEYLKKSHKYQGQFNTAISLTFRKK